ncbi:MAG: NAD(P)-dependent glycerol-3-phosphate dehydrogenase [Xanthomonadales bacterium]|nr:NAD(P)-dependent glycerol-3-phosphate dehydrogenase [Gammaproteobacteria bacterium]MBT8054996.1 NAD(P)-dependent glycerol-3-phosphate dehydrogenase [Gammaproteobacteria bacterium]NND56378.1 NAD(P)-dependent glycerol-3-phosphate dehydrogenase [Xanthomonadales bacterium]NNK50435.1 NAD(P)-dependent glycerol-3-phosphate dehydrogenase [Xanthomonadales bacterium]
MQLMRAGNDVVLWDWDREHIASIGAIRCNEKFLPDFPLDDGLRAEPDLQAAVSGANEILVVVPSHAFVGVLEQIKPWLRPGQGIAWACKGLEPGTGQFLHEPAMRLFGEERPLAVVTGPSFAREVAANLPTAITVAGTESGYCERIARALHGGNFRAYTSDDILGAELGGSVKNVLAVATGICDGMGLGNNARAALITRGLVEMMRLGRVLGARDQTLTGLTGMGDLVLTCTGDLSRNRRLGLALGAGQAVDEAVAEIGQVVEGVKTALEVRRLARRHKVEMPIAEEVYSVLHEGRDPYESVRDLLSREQKQEAV